MTASGLTARFVAEARSRTGRFRLAVELDHPGGVLILFGPSGSGKTLTLRALAGLLRPESGRIQLAGTTLFDAAAGTDLPPHRRHIAWMPQGDTLFPHRSVAENVGLAASARSVAPGELLRRLGLEQRADARPDTLSGGERRRAALARAVARGGELLMLDEPTSGLDDAGRHLLLEELRGLLGDLRLPTILVTHRRDEALRLGDRIVLLEAGRTTASGRPAELLGEAPG